MSIKYTKAEQKITAKKLTERKEGNLVKEYSLVKPSS